MNAARRIDRKSGDAQVAGTSRSPLLRLPMRSDFFRQAKNHALLAPSASDRVWSRWKAKDKRRRSRLEAECLAAFNQPADQSTYPRGKTVRTTRATANIQISYAGSQASAKLSPAATITLFINTALDTNGDVVWVCGTQVAPTNVVLTGAGATTVPAQYLPSGCHP